MILHIKPTGGNDFTAHGQARPLRPPAPRPQRHRVPPAAAAAPTAATDGQRGLSRARSHCRFVLPLIHSTPDPLTYSVPLFLKRQAAMRPNPRCARTVPAPVPRSRSRSRAWCSPSRSRRAPPPGSNSPCRCRRSPTSHRRHRPPRQLRWRCPSTCGEVIPTHLSRHLSTHTPD